MRVFPMGVILKRGGARLLCVRLSGELPTAAGVACEERPDA